MSEQAQKSTPARRRLPVAVNSLNTLVLTRDITLATTFAADQLHAIAKKDSLVMFMAVYADIFGVDIPTEAYKALYEDAQKKASILYPAVEVAGTVENGAKASFNSATQTISVSEKAVLEALEDNKARGELMTMLIEEYGHYLDYLLRKHYAKNSNPDASGDEGAKFTYSMYVINPLEQSDQHFADVTMNGNQQKLIWDFSELHNNLRKHVNAQRQNREDRQGDLEFFKAGILEPHGQFGHQDVTNEALREDLLSVAEDKNEVNNILATIYLGNWLRDFSQVVDPMIIRPMAYAAGRIAGAKKPSESHKEKTKVSARTPDFDFVNNRMVEFSPVLLSVEAMTTVVEMAAAKEFIHQKGFGVKEHKHRVESQDKPGKIPDGSGNGMLDGLLGNLEKIGDKVKDVLKPENIKKSNLEDYQGHLNKLRKEFIEITPETLGVYRPEEHIDNPKGIGQGKDGDSRGDKQLYHKFVGFIPDSHPLHCVNRRYAMKNYIRSGDRFSVEGDSINTAYGYIVAKLKKAGVSGGLKNPKALVEFGAAMHTLEDYFAHTNYAEISLIKSVEPMVFPWVDEVNEPTGFKYRYEDLYQGKGYDRRYILLDAPGRLKPGNQLASYIPVVTGTFGTVDTAASVLPVLNEHLFSIEIKPWEEEKREPGERTFAEVLIRELLADIDKAQADKRGNTGSNDTTYVDVFDVMLNAKDVYSEVSQYVKIEQVEKLFNWLTQHVRQLMNFTQYFIIRNIAAVLNDAQVGLDKDLDLMKAGSFHIGMDPSHTQLAKDDPDHPIHELAGLLAVEAVRKVGREMIKVWRGGGTVEADVLPVLDRIMRHPAESDWQDSIVTSWAKSNTGKVCAASSPSIIVDRVLHAIEHIDESLGIIKKYLTDDTVTGKLVSFFTTDEEAMRDINALKNRVSKSVNKSRDQLSQAKAIKSTWDSKYPKPKYCKTHASTGEKDQSQQKADAAHGSGNLEKKTEANQPESIYRYKIVKGDSLWGIAKQNGTTVEELRRLNGLKSDVIHAGKELKVPKPT